MYFYFKISYYDRIQKIACNSAKIYYNIMTEKHSSSTSLQCLAIYVRRATRQSDRPESGYSCTRRQTIPAPRTSTVHAKTGIK